MESAENYVIQLCNVISAIMSLSAIQTGDATVRGHGSGFVQLVQQNKGAEWYEGSVAPQ